MATEKIDIADWIVQTRPDLQGKTIAGSQFIELLDEHGWRGIPHVSSTRKGSIEALRNADNALRSVGIKIQVLTVRGRSEWIRTVTLSGDQVELHASPELMEKYGDVKYETLT